MGPQANGFVLHLHPKRGAQPHEPPTASRSLKFCGSDEHTAAILQVSRFPRESNIFHPEPAEPNRSSRTLLGSNSSSEANLLKLLWSSGLLRKMTRNLYLKPTQSEDMDAGWSHAHMHAHMHANTETHMHRSQTQL